LAAFLAACPPMDSRAPLTVRRWFVAPTAMGPMRWPVAPLDSVRDLQDLLGLSTTDLQWFADVRQLERTVTDEALRHYRYRWIPKGSGGLRLVEKPKPVLKHVQRVLLREILERVPVHPAAHGFRRGHSAVTHAARHQGRQVVIRLDLEDFFASVEVGRIYGLFRRCGYPEPVAHLLAGLTTNSVPRRVWAAAAADPPSDPARLPAFRRLGRHLAHPHLPQGAPSSPALANLVAFGLDRRLAGLSAAVGMTYTRYADDLAFSSPARRTGAEVRRLVDAIGRIAAEVGFRVNPAKTSVRGAGQRQRLAGVVVNQRPNVERGEYDRLKAILHNAARTGPVAQNRAGHPRFRDHLRGRIAWVGQLNPERGERLLAEFSRIRWEEAER
ncbi:MAG TPA: reverse transcriptase family protein, partial [Acidimicrobiales bacterium]